MQGSSVHLEVARTRFILGQGNILSTVNSFA